MPVAGVQLELVTESSGSVKLTVYGTDAPVGPVASVVMSLGMPMTGGVWSFTVTWKEADEDLPWESVALQFTVVFPNAKAVPEAGVQLELVTVSSGSVKLTV